MMTNCRQQKLSKRSSGIRKSSMPLLVVLLGLCGVAGIAHAAPPIGNSGYDIAILGTKPGVPACASCHGANGQGRLAVGIPRLAGLSSAYIDAQLNHFQRGSRANELMTPYAKLLTPSQMHDVATFFASKPLPSVSSDATPLDRSVKADFARGEDLANNGIWQSAMPACGLCHGAGGGGVGAEFPSLSGQSSGYLIGQLDAWKTNRRRDKLGVFMRAEALHMTQADIRAVATYYSLLQNTPKPVGDAK